MMELYTRRFQNAQCQNALHALNPAMAQLARFLLRIIATGPVEGANRVNHNWEGKVGGNTTCASYGVVISDYQKWQIGYVLTGLIAH